MKITAQNEFKLDFSGPVGLFFKKKRKGYRGLNSETYYRADTKEVWPTNRRWIQFLDGAEKITNGYIEPGGKVQISELAKEKYGYEINECDDLIKEIHELAREQKYWIVLFNAPRKNDEIDGFSLPEEKKIYYKAGITPAQKNFVIAHELSHYLLGHKGKFFYRDTSNSLNRTKKLHEKKEYTEEADKLAAILLMPHVYMQNLLNEPVSDLAKRFDVFERAVEKRIKEVARERTVLCYIPSSPGIQR